MHSIKKVEESARIARDVKRQKKCQEIDGLRKKIFATFKNIDGHERDFLDLSELILKAIPDLYTFWIMRREVLMKIKQKMEADPSFTVFNEDEIKKLTEKKGSPLTFDDLLDRDTKLSEEALFHNPKSYSAWNHRKFLMEFYASPPLKRELEICEKALLYDSRNFHVWDYRRFIVKLLNRTMEEELEFSKHMVEKNPSNYSAWHYRINKLLESGDKISDEMFVDELNSVTEVCVVNSEDQTAWTYVNWLIERFFNQEEPKKGLENVISFTDNEMIEGHYHSTLVLQNSVTTEELKEFITIDSDDEEWQPRGESTTINMNISSLIWDIYSKTPINLFDSKLKDSGHFSIVESPTRRYINTTLINEIYSCTPKQMSAEVAECLNKFYEICQELMKDNQENNPWEFCLAAYLLPIISGINDETEAKVKTYLEKAKLSDQQRRQMYDAMANKVILTNFLHQSVNESTVLNILLEKEGKLDWNYNDYSCLRPLAGIIRLQNPPGDIPFVIQAQLRWFLLAAEESLL